MSTSNKLDWSYLLLLPYMAVRCVPWLGMRFQTRYVFVFFVIWFFLMISRGRRATQFAKKSTIYFKRALFFLIMFLLMRFFYQLFGYGSGCDIDYVFGIVLNITTLLILHLSVSYGRQRELGLLVLWIIICYTCVCIMTIVGEKSTEFISRTLTGQVGAGDVNMIEISDGIAQRNQIYSLALMVAPMLYYTKYMPFPIKILIPLGAALFFWTAYITAYSSCMIGLLLSGALLLMIKVGIRAKQIMIIGVLSVTIIIVGTFNPRSFSFLVPPLSAIQKMTEISEYKLKIDAVVESISGAQETHLSLRTDLYKKSWCAFCSSPILGVGMWAWNSDEERERRDKLENVGGHSGTIDILGQTGLVGASLFILMIVSFMQYLRVITPTFFLMRWRFVVYNYMFPCVIYMSVSNRGFSIDDPSLTLMLPGMIYLVKEFRRSISSHIDMRHDLLKY